MIPKHVALAIQSSAAPVVLLEGTRRVTDDWRAGLVALGRHLAGTFPNAVFRSGNAAGADEAFAEGVASVTGSCLQLVLPTASMGRSRRPGTAQCWSLDQIPEDEIEVLVSACAEASPKNRRLFDLFVRGPSKNHVYSKTRYLVRDAMKVIGSPALGLQPATHALFFVNEDDPSGGGTGHTLRICQQQGIPVFTQQDWLSWR
jgi:hypothetical protein